MLALASSHSIGQKFAVDIASPAPAPATVKIRSPRFVASYTSAETRRPLYFDSSRMASSASLYEVLGVPMGATCQEIKTAYRKLARTCHPDVVAIGRKDTSADEFMKIHAAYSTLSDPNKRADYDRKIFRRQQRPFNSSSASATSMSTATPMSGFSCYTRRAWETDQCW